MRYRYALCALIFFGGMAAIYIGLTTALDKWLAIAVGIVLLLTAIATAGTVQHMEGK